MTKGQHYKKQDNGQHCDNIELVKATTHKPPILETDTGQKYGDTPFSSLKKFILYVN